MTDLQIGKWVFIGCGNNWLNFNRKITDGWTEMTMRNILSTLNQSDVITSEMASQIVGVSIVCSTVCSGADQMKHQRFASLAFVREIHLSPVDSPNKGTLTRKMFPFDDVIMLSLVLIITCRMFGAKPMSKPQLNYCTLNTKNTFQWNWNEGINILI